MGGSAKSGMLEAGVRAPAVSFSDLEGGAVSLEELLRQGPVALVFFKISCPVCQLALPYLNRLVQSGMPGAPRIVGVSQDDAAKTRAFGQTYAPGITMLLDEARLGYQASNAFGITHVPTAFVTEVDGEISAAWTGFSKADMEQLAQRTGIPVFGPHENVPVWKAG